MGKKAEVYTYDIEVFPNLFTVAVRKKSRKQGEGRSTVFVINQKYNHLDQIVRLFNNRNRWFVGYNSIHFDDQIIHFLIQRYGGLRTMNTEQICKNIYDLAQSIIGYNDRTYKYYNFFNSIDLMQMISVGMQRKALKLVAVNIGWKKIQEIPYHYTSYIPPEGEKFDNIVSYNINDIDITEALYFHLQDDINLRSKITHRYGVNVMSESNSGIGGALFTKLYAEETNQDYRDFVNHRSDKPYVDLRSIISRKIRFQTKPLKKLLSDLRKQTVHSDGGKLKHHVLVGNTKYTVAKGGLHSEHEPVIYKESDNTLLLDVDVKSYYPAIVVNEDVCPDHLDSEAFIRIMERIMIERVEAKKTDPVKAAALKISINGVFGKFGFAYSWLYDLEALYKVTLNGQLFLLILIEALESRGFQVFYGNTDGITTKVPIDRIEQFVSICKRWEEYTDFQLEYTRFSKFVIEDVNSYIAVATHESDDGIDWEEVPDKKSIKRKGRMSKTLFQDNLMKSLKFPIVPTALEEYFLNGTPLKETIRKGSLLDYCMAEKVGGSFDSVHYDYLDRETNKIVTKDLSRINRYLVSPKGGTIYKVKEGRQHSLSNVKGELVILINDIDEIKKQYPDGVPIRYDYYLRKAREIQYKFVNVQKNLFETV